MRVWGRSLRSLIVLVLVGCAADAPSPIKVERVDSAGVEVVTNRGADQILAWSFEREFALGGEDDGPESFYLVSPTTVGVDAEGRIYVLDATSRHVVVFDADGGYLRTLGREGGGPGELTWPSNMSVALDGTVSVYDFGKRALVRFGPGGEILDELRPEIGYQGPSLRVVGPDIYYTAFQHRQQEPTSFQRLMVWRDGEARELAQLEHPTTPMVSFPSCGFTFPASPVFAPTLVWDAVADVAVANRGVDYVVDVYRDGRLALSVRRDIAPRAVTEALALRQLEAQGRSINNCPIPAEEYLQKAGHAPVIPVVQGVTIELGGGLWVRRGHVAGEAAPVDIFGGDGTYRGTLPAGSPFPVLFLPDGRIAAIEKDEMDIMRLVVYRTGIDRT